MNSMKIETSEENNGFLNVDATYVLHLEGNGRLVKVREQLLKRRPTRIVHLIFNPGSNLSPATDIVEAYRFIFTHAREKGYDAVLVLEDDYTWGNVNATDGVCISTYMAKHKHREFVYHLGCVPAFMFPVGGNTFWVFGCGTHASIYTKSCREKMLRHKGKILDWDMYLFFHFIRLAYGTPLCYQLYGRTANSDQWLRFCGLTPLLRLCARMLLLDKRAEPGYWVCYTGAKSVPFIGVVACIAAIKFGPSVFRRIKKLTL